MHDAARIEAAFIVANLDPLRAIPTKACSSDLTLRTATSPRQPLTMRAQYRAVPISGTSARGHGTNPLRGRGASLEVVALWAALVKA
jgi:hypothetical protein